MGSAEDALPVVLDHPTDLLASFRLHRFGGLDPTCQLDRQGLRQAVQTPHGPAVLDVRLDPESGGRRFLVRAVGPGRAHLLARAGRILGEDDDPSRFVPSCAPTRRLVRKVPGLRLTRAISPFAMLVSIVLQQRVAWRDAARAYRRLVLRHGQPGPGGLTLPPTPAQWARIPLAELSALEVERKRADTLRRVARIAGHLDRMFDEDPAEVRRKLTSVRGLGPWTIETFLGFGLAHPDAVPLDDYDLPHRVAHLFLGKARSDDAEMLRILEPYRGQRWRVLRLLDASGADMPRFGPRVGSGRRRRSPPE